MSVPQLYFFETAKFVHSVHNRYSPTLFHDYFQTLSHSYSTRARLNTVYALPQPRTEKGKRSCVYTGVNIWAKVPQDIKFLSKKSFNFKLKKHIIENCIAFTR